MDELFQKAAEEYPLKTGMPDWESMQQRLSQEIISPKGLLYKRLKHSTQQGVVLTLLIFLPLTTAITGILLNTQYFAKNGFSNTDEQKTQIPANSFVGSPGQKHAINTKKTYADFSVTENLLRENEPVEIVIRDRKALASPESIAFNSAIVSSSILSLQQHLVQNNTPDYTVSKSLANDVSVTKNEVENIKRSEEKKTTIKIKSTTSKRIYGGVLAAAELTSVMGQSFRKPGFNGGFLFGYNLNERWQAELGVVLSRKYFYSDGKYAAPNSMRQDGLEVNGIKANSRITEIPVTLRYNFKKNDKEKIFVSAGGVSSIVHHERYNYAYTKNGREKNGFKAYNESIDNIFSNLHVSVGYEHKLGNIGDVRIDPYYRIPLNGIGAGDLPVTSIGINVGLVRYFR